MFSRGTRTEQRLPRRPLLKSQKNDVFELVNRLGMDPSVFDWTEAETTYPRGVLVDVLRYRNREWFCGFGFNDQNIYGMTRVTLMSPGRSEINAAVTSPDWNDQLGAVAEWLRNVQREESQPSLWDTIPEAPVLADIAGADFADEPLTAEQQEWVAERVVLIRQYVRTIPTDAATLLRIEAKLDDLAAASGRLSAKDFINSAMGVLMGIAAEAAMNSDQAKHLFDLMFAGTRHLLGF